MKQFLLRFFTWWNGATLNTLWHTRRHGEFVGQDEFGNRYYRTRGGAIDPALGFERRWVIYNGLSEGSMTPAGWNGWLHHTVDVPPSQEDYRPRDWERSHIGNPTGTPAAIRPKGSTMRRGVRQATGGDYQAWTPEG
ncbi:MAG TPA: NADH:ubiquinone oxidoreductase subunit NDUFA12 [Roseiarcus sp.]|nr:NADH:ubiquinone oxidoreductase subunit NDUFA12 [Roseiarcus sp.]